MRYGKPRIYEHSSRYGKYRQLVEDENTWLETVNQVVIPKTDDDIYHIVTKQQAYRPDIIANIYYNDASLYWAILMANEIVDPFILDAGTIIRVPAFISLYTNDGVLDYYGKFNT